MIHLDINKIISFILNPTFSGWLLALKITFLVISALFFGFIIFALIKSSWLKRLIIWDLKEFLTYRHYAVSKLAKEWEKVKEKLKTGSEAEYKLAVIEADQMLDNVLARIGIKGEDLREKLAKLKTTSLPNLEEVKEAHQIRNNIVSDPDYKLTLEEAKKIVRVYEEALTSLQAL